MNLTKNHLFNIVFWIIIFVFMGYKSIEHTIHVHEQGVLAVFQDYKFQAQARLNFLKLMNGDDPVRPPIYMDLNSKIKRIDYELDPYQYVKLNNELTLFINQSIDRFRLTQKEAESIGKLQAYVEQEALIYNSHANSFNLLISRFPYKLFSSSYELIPTLNYALVEGVIVER
ncbi:MAG: hypothetical protein VW397_06790 [Candidatus Margulisiibacteriota bacterium]